MPDHRTARSAALNGNAPILLVRDVQRSIEHYRDALGFEVIVVDGDPPDFALVRRDRGAVMLRRADDPSTIRPNWTVQSKTSNIYFWVDDAAALYKEYQQSGATIDWSLYDTPWGMREFGVQDIDGYDIAFGQILS